MRESPQEKRKSPRTVFWWMLGAGSLLVIPALLWPREPQYHGKPLTEWCRQYGSNNWGGSRASALEAQTAIRAIGTNHIPFLLELTGRQNSALLKGLRKTVPPKWHKPFGLHKQLGDVRRTGAHGIAALGTNAAAAIPGLVELIRNHPDEDGRYIAAFALRTIGPAAEPAIPFIIQCLTNSVSTIRDEAVTALGNMGHVPDKVVPPLIQHLRSFRYSPGHWELQDNIASLAKLGPAAKQAVPTLLSFLDHPIAGVREAVTNALPHIDREASAKAGIKTPF